MSSVEEAVAEALGHGSDLPKARTIDQPPWRGFVTEPFDGEELREFLSNPLALFDLPDTETIKASRNRLTRVRLQRGGRTFVWVVKEFSNRRAGTFLKNSWRKSKAQKGWNKARALLSRKIATPMPRLALDCRGPLGLVSTSVLVVDDLGEVVQLRKILKHFRKPDPALPAIEKEVFLESLAAFVRHMHNYGVLHRDLSGGNILIEFRAPHEWGFSIVDINRAEVAPALRPEKRLVDLERINIEPEDRRAFFAAYCKGAERLAQLEPQYLKRVEIYRNFREKKSSRYRLTKYLPFG